MNKIFLKTFFIMLLSVIVFSCKKDENKVYYLGGTAPALNAVTNTGTDTIKLDFTQKTTTAIAFTWSNPNYQFTTGVSSQDVYYTLQIDTTGSNFTNPNLQNLGYKKDLGVSTTVSQFNGYLLNQLQLSTNMYHHLDVRLVANMVNSSATLISNTLSLVTKPYDIPPVVTPPGTASLGYTDGVLFLVGSATAGAWNNPVPVPSQQFTQVSPTLYTITVPLIGAQEYLFLPKNGDWSHKFACANKALPGLNAGGDFGADLSDNFPGPTASGNYKIDVDFKRGKFVVTKL